MGIRTVMITGDNPQTAAAIAAEAGVDDFLAQATPEAKLRLIREAVTIPVIASGGAGDYAHFADLFETTGIDGGLAASVFHSGQIPIPSLKRFLQDRDIEVRL